MEYLAHSARPELSVPVQAYGDHARATREQARKYASECGSYSQTFGPTLVAATTIAGEFHDLGKLDEANQKILQDACRKKLPVPHDDAGAAHLLGIGSQVAMNAALVCYSHHRGLPSIPAERNRQQSWMRVSAPESRGHTDAHLAAYVRKHRDCVPCLDPPPAGQLETKQLQLLWRLALSCLADADHGDTARHYGEASLAPPPALRADERLLALDAYVAKLRDLDPNGPRTLLREQTYRVCRDAASGPSLQACDAPVGSGKTTAVMAHLLRAASQKSLRRVFVVLPYTNIISQAVEVYREALILDGERPDEVVAEHHHRADYHSHESRRFAMLWKAPILVTTAVQFFETLASNMPGDLRKLHSLPGSAVFLDEAHAALPAALWPLAWQWLKELSEEWSCHFVLASGSLTRFWELPDFHAECDGQKFSPPVLPELLTGPPRIHALEREQSRVCYRSWPEPLDLNGLVEWLCEHEGPRLVVMNTVQSAAVVAREIAARHGRGTVEHISTALTPVDRETSLRGVRNRLDRKNDSNWTLVATSCVEAGVNLSFHVGFRERASLMSPDLLTYPA